MWEIISSWNWNVERKTHIPGGAIFDIGWVDVGLDDVDDAVADDDVADAASEAGVDADAGSDDVLVAINAAKVNWRSVKMQKAVICLFKKLPLEKNYSHIDNW